MPSLEVSASGSVQLNNAVQSKVSDMNIKFHGDLLLPENPTTFEEAVKIYKQLPNFVKSSSVPMKVHLVPLKMLNPSGTFDIIREISQSLITDVVTTMQELEDAKEEAQDLSLTIAARYFSFIARNIENFLNLLRQYKQEFQGHIAPLLVEIRGSGTEESELSSYLQQHFNSPFSKENLKFWLQRSRDEIGILESFIDRLQNVTFCENTATCLREILKYDQVISLNMYFPDSYDTILDQMSNFLETHNSTNSGNEDEWFYDGKTLTNFRIATDKFMNCRRVNIEDITIAFICAILPSPDRNQRFPNIQIKQIYTEGGRVFEENLTPPHQLTGIRQTIGNDTVLVQWDPPSHAAFIRCYQIVVSQRGLRHSEESIQYRYHTVSNETEFQITIPDSSIPYDVYV